MEKTDHIIISSFLMLVSVDYCEDLISFCLNVKCIEELYCETCVIIKMTAWNEGLHEELR